MKLNRQTLRKMILKEIKLMTESQVYPESGLSHNFSNYELARKLFSAVSEGESEENLRLLRKTALKREADLQHKLSLSSLGEEENIKQEIMLLNQAIDNLDHHLGEYSSHVVGSASSGQGGIDWDDNLAQYGMSQSGRALQRRYKRVQNDLEKIGKGSSIGPYDPNDPRYL